MGAVCYLKDGYRRNVLWELGDSGLGILLDMLGTEGGFRIR